MPVSPSNYDKLAFSTQFRYQTISLRGSVNYSMGADPYYNITTTTIRHGLGYKPYFRIYIKFPGSGRIYEMETGPGSYGLVNAYQIAGIGSDNTNITVQIESYNGAGGTGTIYYRIYEESQ